MLDVSLNRSIRIVALTEAGRNLAEKLLSALPNAKVLYKPKPFAESVQNSFSNGEALILICATGIAVRTLAPVITNKYDDPPVLVLDEDGQFVIPLLSGHEGGANDWAYHLAEHLKAHAVITTANTYIKPVYTIGMGCERGCPEEELHTLLQSCLTQAQLTLDQISSISSISLKADEEGLISLAESLQKPFNTYNVEQLSSMEYLLSTKSDYVFNTVGVYGVAESAALFSAQIFSQASQTESESKKNHVPELVLKKQKTKKATCAIARCY